MKFFLMALFLNRLHDIMKWKLWEKTVRPIFIKAKQGVQIFLLNNSHKISTVIVP